MEKQGKLLIIGFGPGALEQITGRALAAIEECDAVIGYNTYVELIKPLLKHQEIVGTGMTEEVSRAQEAVRRAEAGQKIAVISSGDAGVYGMAGLVYEVLMERGWSRNDGVEVEVIPGISAIQSCSSLLGAPIMHDSCTISLSDHLTPWETIAARVEAAAAADFVIAFYNPRSGKRTRQIEEARGILLRHRDPATPVGIVKNAYREKQQIVVTTLQEMLEHEIGMLSTVVIGNSATTVYDGLMVTPRGYERKYDLSAETQALKPHERLRTTAEPWSLAASTELSGSGTGNGGRDAGGSTVKGGSDAGIKDVRIGCIAGGSTVNSVGDAGVSAVDGTIAVCAAPASAPGPQLASAVLSAVAFEAAGLEVSPELGSRRYSGVQLRLMAELAGDDGQLVYSRDGHFLLRSSLPEQVTIAEKLAEAGLHVSLPGNTVNVKTCGFCELRKNEGLGLAVRLHRLVHGQPVPRSLQISVAGCGMACSAAVLEDVGVVYSKGSYELYLGGKKSGRGAHAGRLVCEGMNEDEAVAAVAAVVEQYRSKGKENERFYTFFESQGGAESGLWAAGKPQNTELKEEKNIMSNLSKKTILLVGHGSRVEEGNEELRSFTAQLADRKPELHIETCFIELASPSIAGGIERCVAGGATTVYVVPIILFAAGHSKLDIPMALDQAKQKYPSVEFVYGRPVGVQERAVDILLDRISEAVPVTTQSHSAAEPVPAEDTIVLMMGRGGSDPDANSDFYKLGRLLWEKTSYKSVENCFIAITGPSLNEGLDRCLNLGARKIIVLPYLLFTGVLMQQFTERVTEFAAQHPEVEVALGSYIGTHPLLADMLVQRIEETLEGQTFANCDNCRYRDEAAAHHHHHHHDEDGHGHGHHHHHHHGEAGHGHEHHHDGEAGHSHGHHDHHHSGADHSHGGHHHHDETGQSHSHHHHEGDPSYTTAAETAAAAGPQGLQPK